jgi:antitoxin ParD1/3/4
MNVSLTPELEQFINEKVSSGMYSTASEVVREALRLLSESEEIRRRKFEALKRDIAVGLEQANRGELIDGEKAFERIQKSLREKGARKK